MVLFEGKPFKVDSLRDRVRKYANEIARKAKQVYAPIGWTGDLRRGIKVRGIEKVGSDIVVTIVSGAPYSWKVHNTPMRHTQYPGQSWISFGDLDPGQGSTRDIRKWRSMTGKDKGKSPAGPAEQKYWRGYYWAVKNSRFVRYAASFFTDAADDARRNDYDKIMGPSLRK